jgi:hypothetical protein
MVTRSPRRRIEVGLVAADDELLLVNHPAAILHARVAADDFVFETQFEIGRLAPLPDQERVVLEQILGSRAAGDRAVGDTPVLFVAFPAGEIGAVEQAGEPLFIGGITGNDNADGKNGGQNKWANHERLLRGFGVRTD